MKHRVSVVVPVYNTERYLDKCIRSIVSQTYKDIEVVLVDDGSTDNSGLICDKFGDSNENIIVIHQKNMGPIVARRVGIETASGEYVGFVDSDDWVDSHMYETLVRQMTENEARLVCTGMYREKDGRVNQAWKASDFTEGFYSGEKLDELKKELFKGGRCRINGSMCNKLFVRKDLISIMDGIDSRLYWGEDRAVTLTYLIQSDAMVLSNDIFYHGVERDESATHSEQPEVVSQTNLLYLELKKAVTTTSYYDQILPNLEDYYICELLNAISRTYPGKYDYRLPYDCIDEIGKDIAIYGAGKVGNSLHHYFEIDEKYNVIGWFDRSCEEYRAKGISVDSPATLSKHHFDTIIIAVYDSTVASSIKDELVKEYDVDPSKILWKRPLSLYEYGKSMGLF